MLVCIPNYSIVRCDRNRRGGGVAIFIHNSIRYHTLVSGPANLELLVVSLSRNNFKLCLGVFYRPPSSPNSIFDILCNTLFFTNQSHFSNFVIVGDFNVNFDSSHPLAAQPMRSPYGPSLNTCRTLKESSLPDNPWPLTNSMIVMLYTVLVLS